MWFKTQRIDQATWAIDDHGCDVIYLTSGQERCLLIDTGWGVGHLQKLAASLAPLPLIVVNSHGHPDHTFGNGEFAEVHIHKDDQPFVNKAPSTKSRRSIMENHLPKPLPPDFDFDTWATSIAGSLIPMQDGHIFDLGNRSLEVISVPGHTPGSICLLDRGARFLFTGDSVLSGPIWLHLDESLPLAKFHKNLQRLQRFADEFDYIFPAHGDLRKLPLPKGMLDELVSGVESILAGELVGQEEKTFAGDGLRCEFDSCGIVYRPDRL